MDDVRAAGARGRPAGAVALGGFQSGPKKKGVAAESFIRRHGPGWSGVQSARPPSHAGALALDDKETAPGPGASVTRVPFFFFAEVITVAPEQQANDFVISEKQIKYALGNKKRQAIVIRTLPNLGDKKSRHYSDTNPPYLTEAAAKYLVKKGVEHLLIDLPSVDKERDGGELLAHKAFWNKSGKPRQKATITEFIYVPNKVEDGTYFLNLQVAPFENDASPSRPVLYKIETK